MRGRRGRGGRLSAAGLDVALLAAVAGLVCLGAVLVWTATAPRHGTAFLTRQLLTAGVGAVGCAALASTSGRWLRIAAGATYLLAVLGLLAVLSPLGASVNGARAWLPLPGTWSLQPSELAKVGVVCALALALRPPRPGTRLGPGPAQPGSARVVRALALAAVPLALVVRQPDLGTALVLAVTVLAVLLAAGASARWLVGLALAAGTAVVLVVQTGVLASYQLARFAAFADPGLDPRGVGWNTAQARLAVGGGGLTGQGLFDGALTGSGRVPEQHTDFVFTAAAEQLGFLGAAALLGLLTVVLWRGLRIAGATGDPFGRLVAVGVVAWLAVQSFENIGMCLGLVPVTGVPLPFLSYGGSSMLACLLAVGLLLAVRREAGRRGPGDGEAPDPRLSGSRGPLGAAVA